MASRPQIEQFSAILNGDMSQASLTSTVSVIPTITRIGYSFSWSGSSPVGAVSIQLSNDYSLNPGGTVYNAGTWTTYSFPYAGSNVTSVAVSGNTGTLFINLVDIAAYAIRAVYTKTSGTGTLQCLMTGKVA